MKIKTSELTGAALDWAVWACEKPNDEFLQQRRKVRPYSTDWSQGGPIIEREGISISAHLDGFEWFARDYWGLNEHAAEKPLEAAMRCYVGSKLGNTIDIPDELV